MKVRWLIHASDNLQEIADYLHEHAPAVASEIITKIYEGAMALGEMPYLGRLHEHGRTRRLLLAQHYLVTYRIAKETVHILRVRHTSRKPVH